MTNYSLIVYNSREMAVHSRVEKQTVPVRKKAYEHLKTAILSGHLSPKERLTEEHLAETLGVSRTPRHFRRIRTQNHLGKNHQGGPPASGHFH